MIEGLEGEPIERVKGTLKEEDNGLLRGSRNLKRQESRDEGLE